MNRWLLIALLAVGAIARLACVGWPGTRDVNDWKATSFVDSLDLVHVYGWGGSPPSERKLQWDSVSVTTEYPPVSQYELALVGLAYRQLDPGFHDSQTLSALIKAPGLFAEILFVGVLLTVGRHWLGDKAAEWAALAFWLNPAVWLDGAALGYLDAQMAVPAVFALVAADRGRFALSGAFIAFAALTKPQALFVVPALAVVVLKTRDGRHARAAAFITTAAAVVTALAFLPFAAAGAMTSVLRAFQRFGEHDLVSGTATNLWWLIAWVAGSLARLRTLGFLGAITRPATMVRISILSGMGLPNPRIIGSVLTLAAFGIGTWRALRATVSTTCLGAWFVCAYFIVAGQVHENHSYLALPCLAVAASTRSSLRGLYVALSAVFTLNVYMFYGLGQTMPPWFERSWTFIDASILLSIAYIVVFWKLTRATFSAG